MKRNLRLLPHRQRLEKRLDFRFSWVGSSSDARYQMGNQYLQLQGCLALVYVACVSLVRVGETPNISNSATWTRNALALYWTVGGRYQTIMALGIIFLKSPRQPWWSPEHQTSKDQPDVSPHQIRREDRSLLRQPESRLPSPPSLDHIQSQPFYQTAKLT